MGFPPPSPGGSAHAADPERSNEDSTAGQKDRERRRRGEYSEVLQSAHDADNFKLEAVV